MLRFYRANSEATGCCASFYVNRQGNIMMKFVKQASYNKQNKSGDFKSNSKDPYKNAICKVSRIEAAGIIDSFEHAIPYDFEHWSATQQVTCKFDKSNVLIENLPNGFTIGLFKTVKVDKAKVNFSILLSRDETRLLVEEMKGFLSKTAIETNASQD